MDQRRLDSVYASEVRSFHSALWEQWRKNGVSDEALQHSLRRLYVLGYGDAQIAVMFGVSRERVRQWRDRLGLNAFAASARCAHARTWDDVRGHFRALAPGEAERRTRSWRNQLEDEERRHRREELRARSVRCLHLLVERNNAVPTRSEIAAELRITLSLLTATWREPGDTTPHRDAFRRLYAAAGVPDSGRHRARQRGPFPLQAVRDIRRAYDRGTRTITELAWEYRVSYACIWRILRDDVGRELERGPLSAGQVDWNAGDAPRSHWEASPTFESGEAEPLTDQVASV